MNTNNNGLIPYARLESNTIIVIVGSSGSGKTSLANELSSSLNIPQLVTTTTRLIRREETHGEDYYFISQERFNVLKSEGRFLETTSYSGSDYGLTYLEVEKYQDKPCCVITDVDGARAIADAYPERVMVFWLKSKPSILFKRLRKRGDGFINLLKRLANAIKKKEFTSPSKLFVDVSFTELLADMATTNNFGIIYYKLLVVEFSHNTTYLHKLETTREGENKDEKTLL